jgi:hypothetical protein
MGGSFNTRKINAPYCSCTGKYEEVFFCNKRFVAARDLLIQMAFLWQDQVSTACVHTSTLIFSRKKMFGTGKTEGDRELSD